MATLRVFLSSTAYDLGVLRSSLRGFIENLGFESILSDYSDVLFDPREHTHTSCIAEVKNCDMVLLIVGSRFGGEAIPSAISSLGQHVDEILADNSEHRFSITQAECLTAFDQGIPVFAFVDSGVLHDYRVYSLNPDVKITYPSIAQPDTAEYIFEFINFLQRRSYGNAVVPFTRIEEIIDHLKKQWPALFQRLLRDNRDRQEESIRIDRLSEQFEDLKTALLATVGDSEARRIAQGVVRYRRLIDFIRSIPAQGDLRHYAVDFEDEWKDFLRSYAGIVEVQSTAEDRSQPPYSVMLTEDGSGFTIRLSSAGVSRIGLDWNDFKSEPKQLRTVLYDTLAEQDGRLMMVGRRMTKEETGQFIAERIDRGPSESKARADSADADIAVSTSLQMRDLSVQLLLYRTARDIATRVIPYRAIPRFRPVHSQYRRILASRGYFL